MNRKNKKSLNRRSLSIVWTVVMLMTAFPGVHAAELPIEGEYVLFGVQGEGMLVDSAAMEMESTLTLNEGGSGSMTMDEDGIEVTSWSVDGNTVSIVLADGGAAQAVVHEGILELDLYGNGQYVLFYAQAGADTSVYKPLSMEEFLAAFESETSNSLVSALYDQLSSREKIHLAYDLHTEMMDSTSSFDVHVSDEVFYSLRSTEVSGYMAQTITFFQDGTAYSLNPGEMTGTVATTTTDSLISENVLLLDELCQLLWERAGQTDFTTESRELNDTVYTAEIYPGSEYDAETVFFFDEQGQLAAVLDGAPPSMPDLGETLYTVHVMDEAVNESLFDISGYEITE